MRLAVRVVCLSTFVPTFLACSDGSSPPAKQAYVPPDAAVYVPPVTGQTPGPVTIVIVGDGEVGTGNGEFDCSADGGTGASCTTTDFGITVYAAGHLPWVFDHWEPSMSTDESLYLASWSASPLTAVFAKLGADAGTAAPGDAGGAGD